MLLERLIRLNVTQRLLQEVAEWAPGEVVILDRRGEIRIRFRPRPAPSPGQSPPIEDASPCCPPLARIPGLEWVACRHQKDLAHMLAPIRGTGEPLGWILVEAMSRDSLPSWKRERLERLLTIVLEEMGAFMGSGSTPREDEPALSELRGDSPAMRAVRLEIKRAMNLPLTVLIQGETGTGKDLAAWLIHHRGARKAGPYVTLNCAALPEALVESQLFGHRRGAFSGADRDQQGLLCAARGGTLFLDEVGELSLVVQAKLLRAIETGEVLPLGAVKSECIDARIVAATNIDLEAAVRAGRFRADLYYRLRVLCFRMPSLRQRAEDIETLAWHALQGACSRLNLPHRELSSEVLSAFTTGTWPGNVRQLIHEIERAAITCDGPEIGLEHLSPEFQVAVPEPSSSLLQQGRSVLERWERTQLVEALERVDWNVARLARDTHVSKRALFGRIARYGIPRPAVHRS